MYNLKANRIISLIMAMLCIGILLSNSPFSYVAKATGSEQEALEESIREKERQIEEAEREKRELAKGKTNIERIKRALEQSKADLSQYVSELDAQVVSIEEKIETLKTKISEKEEEITETQEELAEATRIKDEQYANMKKRVQAIYEQGDNFYLELLLNSGGLSDFLNQMDYVEDLSRYDDRMFKEYESTVEYVKLCEAELEEEEELLQETKLAAEEEQKAVEELISEKESEIRAVQEEILDKERAIREYEAEIAEQNSTIAELERMVENEKRELAEMRTYDGGAFCWPCPAYTRVSSDFGWRVHPTLNIRMFHNGVDLAAPAGSNILAAYDGKVVAASYTAAMGNYVMVNHGDGLYTVYMHASKLCVSQGQEVSRGQVIALVGSTGRSTGNHLHFSVRLNGDYVSPWNYITKP